MRIATFSVSYYSSIISFLPYLPLSLSKWQVSHFIDIFLFPPFLSLVFLLLPFCFLFPLSVLFFLLTLLSHLSFLRPPILPSSSFSLKGSHLIDFVCLLLLLLLLLPLPAYVCPAYSFISSPLSCNHGLPVTLSPSSLYLLFSFSFICQLLALYSSICLHVL